jgi:hypothetical protein
MKTFLILFSSFLLMQPVLAKDPDPANGGRLFNSSACNTSELTAPNPAITNLAQLEKAVRDCDVNHNINWFDDEIHDVVAYLNQTYHKFQ